MKEAERITLCILYLRWQELYFEEHQEQFGELCNWMLEDEPINTQPHEEQFPDVCANCGQYYGDVRAGHVTYGCASCQASIPFSECVVRYMYPPKLAEALRVSECVLETYLATAIYYITTVKERLENNQFMKELLP